MAPPRTGDIKNSTAKGIILNATAIGSVLCKRLVEDADARHTPHEEYDVRDGFVRLAERDTAIGGGPLRPDEIELLESIDFQETLAEIIERAEHADKDKSSRARLALLDIGGEPVLMLTHPADSFH